MRPTDRSYQHIARAVFDTPWLIRPAEGSTIAAIVRGRLAGERLAETEISERIQAARAQHGPRGGAQVAGPVAIIPIYGVIMPRANLMTEMSGGTTVEWIRAAMEDTLRDKDIAAIIAEFDSPGGSVEGIEELATWIREQRGTKPMVAVVNTMACSAAYYLAAQFDEIVASPSSLTGSIGVFTEHVEYSKADELAGIKTTIVQQPATKHDINDSEPLSDLATAHIQQIVDDYYGQFTSAVAKGRGVAVGVIRDGYGQGRELTSARAKAAGLVDRIDTLDNTIRRLASGRGRAAMQPAASSEFDVVTTHEPVAALASGLPFSERLALASALAADIATATQQRAALRAEEGRDLSAANRTEITDIASSLRASAAGLEASIAPAPPPQPRPRARLELLEAAFAGGYQLDT